MEAHQEAMVKSLVAVAWADGQMDKEEEEVIEALIAAFQLDGSDAAGIREYAKTPRQIEDIPLGDLSFHDRQMLIQHAVILTYIDGKQTDDEVEVLNKLKDRLHLPDDQAKQLMDEATSRAKRLLDLL
ncbi:MAG: DUF533 domain-containing protein [Myxococcota bacterium]